MPWAEQSGVGCCEHPRGTVAGHLCPAGITCPCWVAPARVESARSGVLCLRFVGPLETLGPSLSLSCSFPLVSCHSNLCIESQRLSSPVWHGEEFAPLPFSQVALANL